MHFARFGTAFEVHRTNFWKSFVDFRCAFTLPGACVSKLVDDIAVVDGLGWPAIETHERAKATAQTFVKPAASGGAWNG
jgi:hypothetical protein